MRLRGARRTLRVPGGKGLPLLRRLSLLNRIQALAKGHKIAETLPNDRPQCNDAPVDSPQHVLSDAIHFAEGFLSGCRILHNTSRPRVIARRVRLRTAGSFCSARLRKAGLNTCVTTVQGTSGQPHNTKKLGTATHGYIGELCTAVYQGWI